MVWSTILCHIPVIRRPSYQGCTWGRCQSWIFIYERLLRRWFQWSTAFVTAPFISCNAIWWPETNSPWWNCEISEKYFFCRMWGIFLSGDVAQAHCCQPNAISKRSFSAIRRLKTYLHSTMGQKRLNTIMLLHVHKETTVELFVIELANMFVYTEHRMCVWYLFGERLVV